MREETMSFTVGQLAKLTGLTVRTLHHYDAIGLLSPSKRSDAGYRLYAQGDIVKLFRIQALQRLGLSLTEIEGVLERAGMALPTLIARQVTLLDTQIEQATTLRSRLAQLQLALARGAEPSTDDWLDAVELITVYERHCSPEELERLLENKNDAASWRALVDDVRAAMADGIPARSARAAALLDRWSELMLRSVGGDLQLAIKMKLAYVDDPSLQARMAVQSGMDGALMQYLGATAMHKQLNLWRRHLSEPELVRVRPDAMWNERLLKVVSALRREQSERAERPSSGAMTAWKELLAYFAAADRGLHERVVMALESDRDLQRCWILDPALIEFMRRA
jgi:DNA-binding transcriptional MerR regulator